MKKSIITSIAVALLSLQFIYATTKHPANMTTKAYKLKGGTTTASVPKVTTSKYSTVPKVKAIYMNKEDSGDLIIGDTVREDRFIDFITLHGFNTVYMYDLTSTLATSLGRQQCASFIERLSALNIKAIGTGGSINTLSELAATSPASRARFNNQMSGEARPLAKFSGLNLEREAWRYPKTGTTTWADWQNIITKVKEYTVPQGITLDAYIGNLEDKQGLQTPAQLGNFIVANLPLLLMHDYMTSTKALKKDALFNYMLERLNILGLEAIKRTPTGQAVKRLDVVVIFSASPGKVVDGVLTEVHMHDYFLTHTLEQAYATFINSANAISWAGKAGINFVGYAGYGVQEFYAVWP